MKADIVEGIKIVKSKQIEIERYSATELIYLISESLTELGKREDKLKTSLGNLDKSINKSVHEIEFNPNSTNTTKVLVYKGLNHLTASRRKVKQELVIVRKAKKLVDPAKLGNKFNCLIGNIVNVNKTPARNSVNQHMPVFKKGELKRILEVYGKVVDTKK